MEFIIAKIADKSDGLFDVLINGVTSGKKTGDKIIIGRSGFVYIEAAGSGLKEKLVNVKDTTLRHPMIIEWTENVL